MTREASEDNRILKQIHRQWWPCWLKKELAERQLFKRQEKHQIARQALDDKRSIRWQEDTQTDTQTDATLLIEKRAGRRPAIQKTRGSSDSKTSHRWPEKHQMTREYVNRSKTETTLLIKKTLWNPTVFLIGSLMELMISALGGSRAWFP